MLFCHFYALGLILSGDKMAYNFKINPGYISIYFSITTSDYVITLMSIVRPTIWDEWREVRRIHKSFPNRQCAVALRGAALRTSKKQQGIKFWTYVWDEEWDQISMAASCGVQVTSATIFQTITYLDLLIRPLVCPPLETTSPKIWSDHFLRVQLHRISLVSECFLTTNQHHPLIS